MTTNMKSKRVLLITPFSLPNIGGAEVHLADYYDYLRDHGYVVTLLTYQPLTTKAMGEPVERQENLTIYRYQWFGFNLFPLLEKWPAIFNFLYLTPYLLLRSWWFMLWHQREFDLIHVFGLNAAFIARILKIFFKKPIYVSMEALYYFDPKTTFSKICKWVLKEFEVVLVGSEDSREEIARLGIPKKRIVVYTHWINTRNFGPADKKKMKKQVGWEDKFTVLYLGRLIELKGIMVFLEIVKLADKKINFKIIGTGEKEQEVKKADREYANLEFVGKVPNREIAKYYQAADVLVYPALYDEDLSLVLLESLACGTPVINTNPGSGVYRLSKEVGFVVKADAKKMAEKVELLYNDRKLLSRMSKAAAKFGAKFGPQLAGKIAAEYK